MKSLEVEVSKCSQLVFTKNLEVERLLMTYL